MAQIRYISEQTQNDLIDLLRDATNQEELTLLIGDIDNPSVVHSVNISAVENRDRKVVMLYAPQMTAPFTTLWSYNENYDEVVDRILSEIYNQWMVGTPAERTFISIPPYEYNNASDWVKGEKLQDYFDCARRYVYMYALSPDTVPHIALRMAELSQRDYVDAHKMNYFFNVNGKREDREKILNSNGYVPYTIGEWYSVHAETECPSCHKKGFVYVTDYKTTDNNTPMSYVREWNCKCSRCDHGFTVVDDNDIPF